MPDGEFYDRCDRCDTDVDATHRSEGVGTVGASHHDFSIYSCDPRANGCGNVWSKSTRQAVAKREARGLSTVGLTAAATAQRATSVPSDRFMRNYEMINWEK